MWHEARKQERLIRGMIVDYRRRAERRKDFYEKIKAEPTQFLQLHGRPCKIHLDPAVAAAGEGPAIMMPWQGDSNNMIDRFDVRAHLDFIPEVKIPYIPAEQLSAEERQCNYERYRILAQNSFLGISEDKFLHQLAIEEQFGVTIDEKEAQRERFNEKEKKGMGAAIGYNYNDPGAQPSSSNGPESKTVEQKDSDEDSDIEIIDVDLSIDVNKMEASQAHELNAVGPQFGMAGCDLFSFLTGDADDAEHQKQLLREEKEKAMFSGRKSRRERRAHRDKKLANRTTSPPSYAAPSSLPSARSPSRSRSPTRSPSPQNHNIQFITSFGGDEEDNKTSVPQKPLYADKLKHNLNRKETYSEVARKPRPWCSDGPKYTKMGPHRPHSRSMSKSRSRSKSYSRSRSRSGSRVKSRSRSKSYSRSITSRSRSRSPGRRSPPRAYSYRNKRSRTPANYSKHNDSRSMSYESSEKVGVASRPVARYYGRRRDDRSSSELSIDSDSSVEAPSTATKSAASKTNTNQNHLRLSGSSSKGPSRETLTLKEKLKRKMQAQLSRQLRADKRAEADRLERESRRQARRDEEMRQLAIKLRRKQREMRHQQNRRSSEDGSNGSRSGSSSRESPSKDRKSRSRSKSPQNRPITVWEENKEPGIVVARPRYPAGESSQQEPRRRQEDEYHQDRGERYPVRGYNNYPRQEENSYHPERRRPYADRGGFRGDRYGPPQPYGRQDGGDDSLEGNPRRVKLVDY